MTSVNCPLCKKECKITTRSSVDSKIKKYFKKHLKSSEYGFCQNEACDIIYFGLESDEMYFKRDFEDYVD